MFIKTYLVALLIFLAVDLIWLGLLAKNFYSEQIGFIMTENINFPAAIIFYLIFVAGIVIFVILPAIEKRAWMHSFLFGAFFGFVAYSTYDLTNLATIKGWPILVTIVDLAWGTFLGSLVSLLTYSIFTRFLVSK